LERRALCRFLASERKNRALALNAQAEIEFEQRLYETISKARDAPMPPALVCRSITAMVRPCQCSSKERVDEHGQIIPR
jgi:hypothetical protein